jgi:hypothetical protein
MRPVFGEVVTASDVERLTSEAGEKAFVRLCATLIASAIGEAVGDFAVPNWSERINVPDRGVDGDFGAPSTLLEAGGLVGPGRNVYQFKWRRLGTRPAKSVIQEVKKSVTGAVRDVLSKGDAPLNRYVLMVNLDLSRSDHRALAEVLRKDCPEFEGRPLIIWGAAEIAAALNSHPHIRHAFFSEGVFCTLGTALEELRVRYEAVGWAEFVGYGDHVRSIQDFVKKPGGRLLLVTGLPYSGKTRMVIEALKTQAARVAWASDPSPVTEDHLRALDTPSGGSVAVLDNTDADHLETFERWARSRSHLKTILISRQSLAMPDVPVVKLEGLSDQDAGALIGQDSQKLPHLMKDWISRLGGNNPGLILYALAAQRELPERPMLEMERGKARWVIGALLRKTLLASLAPNELEALQALSILPQVGTEDHAKDELATIVDVLKRDEVRVRQAIPKLEEKHLLLRKGRFVEVVPELLANELASEVFKVSKEVVAQLWLRLSDPARNRLLRRLLGISDNPDIATLFDEVFSETGWFRTLDDLREQAHRFRLIAQASPTAALRALQRLLRDLDASTLRDSIAGDLRREIVWSLEPLALRAGTFSGAADLLLRLAETENENIANNATGVFLALFHWHHPEVSVPHSERIDFLNQTVGSNSPARRILVARAAGRAVAGEATFFLHHGESMSPPEGPARLRTWGDVWEFHASILKILRQLLKDPEREVRETAFHAALESVREMVRLSVLEDGIRSLAEECFETLKDLAGRELSLGERSELRTTISLIEEDIRGSANEAAHAGRGHEGASVVQDKLKSIRLILEDESFEGQLKRWVGPRAWGDDNVDVEAADRGETEPSTRRISELAAKACENPRLLGAASMDWLMTDEAEHAAPFFIALGGLDSAGVWEDPIIEKLGTLNGPWAFGWYVKGVANKNRARAEEILKRLSLDSPAHVRGILSATFFLPATPGSVERLLSLVDRRLVSPTEVTTGIRYGGWVKPLSTDIFTILVKRLDNGTTETATGLIELLASWLYFSKEMTTELQEEAWRFLEKGAQAENRHFAHSWDRIATWLAERDPQRFFDLLERLASSSGGLEAAKVFAVLQDHAHVWRKLLRLRRQSALLCLLRISLLEDRSPFWLSWCLEHFVDPDTDAEVLMRFATEAGEKGALAVANLLNAGKDGFWRIAEELIAAFPNSARLASMLDSRVGTTGVVTGSFVPTWRHRLDRATALLGHPHPKVSQWSRHVVDWLEDYIRSEEKEDQERFIWDYRISRRQLEGLLRERDSPDRLWAIRRILKRAPKKDALELLTLEDIREGLATVDLPDAERKTWEAYLDHWSHRG